MQGALKPIFNDIADVINYIGIAIIIIGVAKTLIAYAQVSLFSLKLVTPSSLRLNLGRSLTPGPDFQIASDLTSHYKTPFLCLPNRYILAKSCTSIGNL